MNLVDLMKKKKKSLNKSSWLLVGHKTFIIIVGGKDSNFNVGPQAPFTNKNAFEEEKILRKAP